MQRLNAMTVVVVVAAISSQFFDSNSTAIEYFQSSFNGNGT